MSGSSARRESLSTRSRAAVRRTPRTSCSQPATGCLSSRRRRVLTDATSDCVTTISAVGALCAGSSVEVTSNPFGGGVEPIPTGRPLHSGRLSYRLRSGKSNTYLQYVSRCENGAGPGAAPGPAGERHVRSRPRRRQPSWRGLRALSKNSSTLSQLTTFHQLSTYSARRFW